MADQLQRFFGDTDIPRGFRDPRPEDPLWLAPGTRLGCEAGHHTHTVTRGIHCHQRIDSVDLVAEPYQTTMREMALVGHCICGRHFIKVMNYLHPATGASYRTTVQAAHVLGEGWREVPNQAPVVDLSGMDDG